MQVRWGQEKMQTLKRTLRSGLRWGGGSWHKYTCSLKTTPTNGFTPLLHLPSSSFQSLFDPPLLTFRFQSGLLLLCGGEGRPGHADSQQGQKDGGQQPGPRGHPVSGGKCSPYPPSPPPPGHWSHLRGSAQPSTAAGSACHSLEFTQSPGLRGGRERERKWREGGGGVIIEDVERNMDREEERWQK